jgi:hypothetical protein
MFGFQDVSGLVFFNCEEGSMSEPVPIWLMRQATGRCIAPNRFIDSRLAQPNSQVGKPRREIITTILMFDAR